MWKRDLLSSSSISSNNCCFKKLQLNLQAPPDVTRASSSSSVGLRQISLCGVFLLLEIAANPHHTSCCHSNPIQVFYGFFHLVHKTDLSGVLQCPIEPKNQAS